MSLTASFMMTRRVVLCAAVVFAALVGSSDAQQNRTRVGFVNKVQADARLVFNGASRKAGIGIAVFVDDEVQTGAKSRLEITFKDNSVITVGANAKLKIDKFVFNPDKKQGEFVFSAAKGAFRIATGRIGKIAGRRVSVTTPVATIGVRGTEFWGGPIDSQYGVLLLDGIVDVRNPGGAVTLDTPGTGTNISNSTSAPTAPNTWAADKVSRAIDSISFE